MSSPGSRRRSASHRSTRRGLPSVIAAGTTVTGDIASRGDIRIEGSVEGTITAGRLSLARGGCVTGEIHAEVLSSDGTISGKVEAAEVYFSRNARFRGNLGYTALRVEPGAAVTGEIRWFERLQPASGMPQPKELGEVDDPERKEIEPGQPGAAPLQKGAGRPEEPAQTGGPVSPAVSSRPRSHGGAWAAVLALVILGGAGALLLRHAKGPDTPIEPRKRLAAEATESTRADAGRTSPPQSASTEPEVRTSGNRPDRSLPDAATDGTGRATTKQPMTAATAPASAVPRKPGAGVEWQMGEAPPGRDAGVASPSDVPPLAAAIDSTIGRSAEDSRDGGNSAAGAPAEKVAPASGKAAEDAATGTAVDGTGQGSGDNGTGGLGDAVRGSGNIADETGGTTIRVPPRRPPPSTWGRQAPSSNGAADEKSPNRRQDGEPEAEVASLPRDQVMKNYRAGLDAARTGESPKAIALLTPAIRSGKLPEDKLVEAYRERAEAYRHDEAWDRAIADYSAAIELRPGDAALYNYRAYVRNKQGRSEEAIADTSRAIEIDPDFAYAYSNRCWAYVETHQRDKAISDCRKALRLNPGLDFARKTLRRYGVSK